ncbi:MAG: tetratricopeptide repeat protein [Bryobacteraceae bacterium]
MVKKRPPGGGPSAKIPPAAKSGGLPGAVGWTALLCATLAAYWPALRGGMLWDDARHVTKADLQSWHGLWRIWSDLGATQQYYPFLHSAFWVEHRIWGDAVLGYHLTNLALHAACACLVVLLARRLALPGAWLAGFAFALHPVCVESVAWISEQKSTLSGLFYLAAALAYLHYDQSRRVSRYWVALGLFVLALASKTVTATLPAALLVVFWWQRGRIEWKRDLRPLALWLALGACVGLFTAWVEKTYIGAAGAEFTLTPLERCLLAGRAIWFYAGKLLWPANLMFFYPRWTIDPGEWWQYLFPAGVLAAALGLALAARRRRGPLAGFLIFCGTLFPALGFFNVYPFRYSYVADHFQYLASLGLIVPAASALAVAARRFFPNRPTLIAPAAALLALLGVLTWRESGIYADSETLYRETLARNSASWLAHNNLGNQLLETPGHRDEATAHFEEALRLNSGYWPAHNNLGSALAQAPGRLADAISEFQAAIGISPNSAEPHCNLANALRRIPGRLSDAIAEYQTALRLDPTSIQARANLGVALAMAGRRAEAIEQLEAVVRMNPGSADAHSNLANALWLTPGGLPQAIVEYQAALRADPGLAEAHNNLGSALAQMPGRLSEAIAEFEAAIRIKPNYWNTHNNLGKALLQTPGRLPDAIAEFQAAVRLAPDSPDSHYNLGYALSQVPGRLPDAVAEYETALRVRPDFEPAREALRQLRELRQ